MKKASEEFTACDAKLYTRLTIILLTVSLSLYVLFSFVVSPLIVYVNSDATLTFPYLPDLLDLSVNLINLFAFFICYGITAYSLYRFGIRKAYRFVILFSAVTVLKYLMNFLAAFFVFNNMAVTAGEIKTEITASVFNAAVELIQYLIVVAIAYFITRKQKFLTDISVRNAAKIEGFEYDPRSEVFPFSKLFSMRNILQRTAFYSALTVAVFLVVNRLIYDINYGLAKDFSDLLWMIAGYTSDILFALFGYFIMIYTMSRSDIRDIKIRVYKNGI